MPLGVAGVARAQACRRRAVRLDDASASDIIELVRVLETSGEPIRSLMYMRAGARGGSEAASLPVLRGKVDRLPAGLEALLCTADLQGMAPCADGAADLLGIVLVDQYVELAESGVVPPIEATGVLLAGDLYSAPGAGQRGASGDVREVWMEFASAFRWVVGVAGNHDEFGRPREAARFRSEPGIYLLDGEQCDPDGLRIGGVGGIVGVPGVTGRRAASEFVAFLEAALEPEPDLVVLHQPPKLSRSMRGEDAVRCALQTAAPTLAICGHMHWEQPLGDLSNGGQVLNVGERVLVLTES